MIVTILGSGTLVPHPDRGPAGFLVQCAGQNLLVDGGSGTVQRLARAGVDARCLDGAVYTHRHIDHSLDLVHILFAMRVGLGVRRERDFPIWAGRGFTEFISRIYDLGGHWVQPHGFFVPTTEMPDNGPGRAELPGGIVLDTLPANHGDGALHLRFTSPEGKTVVFSGDTGPSESLEQLAAGVDLLVCECALENGDDYPFHLSASHVTRIVDHARPRRVTLTHVYPTVDTEAAVEAVVATGVPTTLASDGDRFDLN